MDDTTSNCKNKILSNDYADLFVEFSKVRPFVRPGTDYCITSINDKYGIIHLLRMGNPPLNIETYSYSAIPRLYALLDTTSMEQSGILQAQNQPVLNLKGQGVMIGFIDTGIDYTNSVFRSTSGESRITAIWDQTIQDGKSPEGIDYGSVYTNDMINEALNASDPYSVVPSRDEDGHGTFNAGIAAGSADQANNFVGAAPEAAIAMVKLKPAKEYLRDFNFIREDAVAYQETDIIMGVKYLIQLREEAGMPLVIYIGLGTNQGYHAGFSMLEQYLISIANNAGIVVITAAGNEANMRHHFMGQITEAKGNESVEIRVAEDERGFALELWADLPELYSVSILSPTGELVPRIPARVGQSTVLNFLLEDTVIYVDYRIVEVASGRQLILLRFQNPTPGVWTIQVYNSQYTTGTYNMWLPITGFISPDTAFLKPNPNITVTSPSTAPGIICIGGYNHRNGSIYLNSGRGYIAANVIKPDLVAPAVDVYGPGLNDRFVERTGTSVAAAHAAGAAASLLTWGVIRGNNPYMDTQDVRAYMIRGAIRSPDLTYPNEVWGFGILNLYNIFDILRG